LPPTAQQIFQRSGAVDILPEEKYPGPTTEPNAARLEKRRHYPNLPLIYIPNAPVHPALVILSSTMFPPKPTNYHPNRNGHASSNDK